MRGHELTAMIERKALEAKRDLCLDGLLRAESEFKQQLWRKGLVEAELGLKLLDGVTVPPEELRAVFQLGLLAMARYLSELEAGAFEDQRGAAGLYRMEAEAKARHAREHGVDDVAQELEEIAERIAAYE